MTRLINLIRRLFGAKPESGPNPPSLQAYSVKVMEGNYNGK